MSDNLKKLRDANDKADPFADRLVAHVLNSRWTILYLVAFAAVFVMLGRLSK